VSLISYLRNIKQYGCNKADYLCGGVKNMRAADTGTAFSAGRTIFVALCRRFVVVLHSHVVIAAYVIVLLCCKCR
jgi:hypothetical protein